MYADTRQAMDRHRHLLDQAARRHQAARLRALRKATRRTERAERRLAAAQSDLLKSRSALTGGL